MLLGSGLSKSHWCNLSAYQWIGTRARDKTAPMPQEEASVVMTSKCSGLGEAKGVDPHQHGSESLDVDQVGWKALTWVRVVAGGVAPTGPKWAEERLERWD